MDTSLAEQDERPAKTSRNPEVPYVPVELYRSAMVRQWGFVYYLLFWFFFRKLKLVEPSGERVRLAANQGPVVYVLRTRSLLDYLALNEVLRANRLPLADYGMAIMMTWYMPFIEAVKLLRDKLAWFFRNGRLPNAVDVGWLSRLVAGGDHAAVFLRPRMRWRDFFQEPPWPDPVPALLEAQQRCARPVQLLPVVVIWNREPERARSSTLRALLGADENAGVFAKLLEVALGHRHALVQVGEAVDLAEYQERYADEDTERRSRRLSLLLRRYLWRERQVVRGPMVEGPRATRRAVLGSARVRRLIEDEALATQRSIASVSTQVLKEYDRMAARFSYRLVSLLAPVSPWFRESVYQGVDMRPEDLEAVRQAQRQGVCVLVPSHKSHVDYVLLSMMLHDNDIVIPHIIAGDNLSFFPMGPLLRRLGAVFIKRSFSGERVFPTLFQAYLSYLFRKGYTVEFFIEGGRSRTGKLLPPKLGVLGMTVESGIETRVGRSLGEVTWLPVSITYERVPEEGPYARELAGREKEPEDFGAFLRALRILVRRQGRVFVRAGEPLQLSRFLEEQGAPWDELPRDDQREALRGLAERISHRINKGVVVVPTGLVALALMAHPRPGVPALALGERVRRFRDLMVSAGAELSLRAMDPEKALEVALKRFKGMKAIEALSGAEDTVYRIEADKRVTLDLYKNGVLHFLLSGSLVAAAIRARGEDQFAPEDLREDLRFQLFLLRDEFISNPSMDEVDWESRGLAQLELAGAIVADEAGWRVLDRARVAELAELTRNFLEGYYGALRAVVQLKDQDMSEKDRVKRMLAVGRQLLAMEELRRAESVSSVLYKNALRTFQEDGLVRPRAGGGLTVDGESARATVASLRRLMRIVE
ncbi:MAG: 1-acyl-sn-glycerol-3-phosphate acyltransferase [Alphaproteobacteria bacterium]|nr:1-acyl-sn-glycerol-3-phosphate acyltransferase [Alphaproteobacteria bacterium]MCB9791503.1 1-acyl-sn-glycerol-3-phosphate acyltransferase [Alphaproteobacteria bacterium]